MLQIPIIYTSSAITSYIHHALSYASTALPMTASKAALSTIFFFNILIVLWYATTMASAQCQGDFQGLVRQCARYVQKNGPKQNPSQICCNVVKTIDLPCVCGHITREVEQIISMEKAAFVSRMCGKPLAHGTKCGSYVVP